LKLKTSFKHKEILLVLGLLLLTVCYIFLRLNEWGNVEAMSAVVIVMAVWWIFEVLPLGITALIPLVTFPIFGIETIKKVAPIYMSSILLLFLGGFLVAICMQKWNLHRRVALNIISIFGSSPNRLILGFMAATSFLSMWISNTAATVMMVSIGLALIKNYEEMMGESDSSRIFATAIMISIAYAATIGGMATLVGTPPNLAFSRIYSMLFPALGEVSFAQWILFGLPISFIILILAWGLIHLVFIRNKNIKPLESTIIEAEKNKLGPMKYEEKCLSLVFVGMALSWIFRKDLVFGNFRISGWSNLMINKSFVDDGMVAIFFAIMLFMIPSKNKERHNRLLTGEAIREIPWQTILLFGGGFALAKGIQTSGLSELIGSKFAYLSNYPLVLIVGVITFGMSFLTELTSNMASTEMLLPILGAMAKSSGINPIVLMVPATLSASCAFMLPAATAPNAIIFGSNRVRIKDMVKVGIYLNILSVGIIVLVCLVFVPKIVN